MKLSERDELKNRLLSGADELFRSYGIKSVTMDVIAKHLSVSKRTIYQFFTDKRDLVMKLVTLRLQEHDSRMDVRIHKSNDALHEVALTLQEEEQALKNINRALFYDIQRYHHDASLAIEKFRKDKIYGRVHDNLVRGMKEGLYRSEINLEIIANMRLMQIGDVLNSRGYPAEKFSLVDMLSELTLHYLYGVVSEEGRTLIGKYFTNKN